MALEDGKFSILDTQNSEMLREFQSHDAFAMDIAFSPANKLLIATVGRDNKMIFYDINKERHLKIIPLPFKANTACFCGEGTKVAVGAH